MSTLQQPQLTKGEEEYTDVETRLANLGRHPGKQCGFVNCPVYRGSTVVFDSFADIWGPQASYRYGTLGNPTVQNLQDAWSALTGAAGTKVVPSGLCAVSLAMLSVVKAGDNMLVADNVYGPTRTFCTGFLTRMGVTVTFYDPLLAPTALADLISSTPNTKAIYFESPGSLTFEVQDVPGIVEVARRYAVTTIMDNTWATPLFFDPLGKGCDISLEAGTKYLGGHSDLLIGLVAANAQWWPKVRETYDYFAMLPGNEDCFLALRGLRTMFIRLKEAERRALEIARWLKTREEVQLVLHPALPDCPGHALWKRDFRGSSGLFSIMLKPCYSVKDAERMVDSLQLFHLGFSWGGFDSLAMLYPSLSERLQSSVISSGPLIRFQIGLENVTDLQNDISHGFEVMHRK